MEIKKQNMVTEGAFEGEAQGRSVQAFMNALPEQFSAEQKLGLWTRLRDLEGSAMLYSKVARIEMNTPGTEVKKFEVNVGTGAPQEFMSKNVRGIKTGEAKQQAAESVVRTVLTLFSLSLSLSLSLFLFIVLLADAASLYPGLLRRWWQCNVFLRLLWRREITRGRRRTQAHRGRQVKNVCTQ